MSRRMSLSDVPPVLRSPDIASAIYDMCRSRNNLTLMPGVSHCMQRPNAIKLIIW